MVRQYNDCTLNTLLLHDIYRANFASITSMLITPRLYLEVVHVSISHFCNVGRQGHKHAEQPLCIQMLTVLKHFHGSNCVLSLSSWQVTQIHDILNECDAVHD